MTKILIYTKEENLDYWIYKITKNLKNYQFWREKESYLICNDLIKICIQTKLYESIRGHRWNEVILDAPIPEKMYYDNIYYNIYTGIKQTENFELIK